MALPTLPPGPLRLDNLTVPGCLVGEAEPLVTRSLTLADGRIVEAGVAAESVDMKGAMVFPAFIDMHTHLDKGHIWARSPNPNGTFDGALEAVREDAAARWSASMSAKRRAPSARRRRRSSGSVSQRSANGASTSCCCSFRSSQSLSAP